MGTTKEYSLGTTLRVVGVLQQQLAHVLGIRNIFMSRQAKQNVEREPWNGKKIVIRNTEHEGKIEEREYAGRESLSGRVAAKQHF